MKKIITFLLTLFLLTNICFSQSGWIWQNPLPQGNTLTSIKFINSTTAYAVGWRGSVIKSIDAGINWQVLNSGLNFEYYDEYWLNENTGIAVGVYDATNYSRGLINKTTNGGLTWTELNSNISAVLSVLFINNSTGFVTCSSGNVLKTTNAGDNWFIIFSGPYTSSKDIFFINENTGYLINFKTLYKTTNTGNNWNSIYVTTEYSFKSVYFVDQYTGFIGSISGNILRTTNSGTSWSQVYTSSSNIVKSFCFINPSVGYSNTTHRILKTTNTGLNWIEIYYSVADELEDIDNVNDISACCVGRWGQILSTSNGGSNWNSKRTGALNTVRSSFALNKDTVFAVGDDGLALRTNNGGINWFTLNLGINKSSNDIFFSSSDKGFIINNDGTMFMSTNFGENWSLISTSTNLPLLDIQFINSMTGWVSGRSGFITKTTNGGLNWNNQVTGTSLDVRGMSFINENTGYIAAGYNGTYVSEGEFLFTIDGGNSWIKIYDADPNSFLCVHFINNNTGWLGTLLGALKTTNGGYNWFSQPNNSIPVNSIYFVDNMNGFMMGYDNYYYGILFRTTNSGTNWQSYRLGNYYNLRNIFFVNQNTGWVCGDYGSILKTTNGGVGVLLSNGISYNTIPSSFSLSQNYPNPFNPVTKIKYDIPPSKGARGMMTRLIIYDILGREIETLVNETQKPGSYEVTWDGSRYASGVYFYRLITDNYSETKKMVLIK